MPCEISLLSFVLNLLYINYLILNKDYQYGYYHKNSNYRFDSQGFQMAKVLITTVPFGDKNDLPIRQLEAAGIEYLINPLGRKLKEHELAEMVGDFEVLIAGTEVISEKVMANAMIRSNTSSYMVDMGAKVFTKSSDFIHKRNPGG